jgi:Flp pilus assembly protein TadD
MGSARQSPGVAYLFFPPENLSKLPALAWIGETLVRSISSQIEKPGVEVLPRETRLSFIEDADLPPNSPLSKASMIRVAQLAEADAMVFGWCSGNESSLRITLQVFDMKTMKLGGDIVAAGPARSLAEMENEMAWQILFQRGLQGEMSREVFHYKTRKIPNGAYTEYVRALAAPDDEARAKLLQQAIDQYPDFPEALAHLGRYLYKKRDCAKAVQRLEGALGLEKFYREIQSMLGNCYCMLGINAKAIRAYTSLLALKPPMEVLNNLGVAYLREGDLPLAVDYLKQARSMEVNSVVVTLNLAILRFLQEDYDAAISLLDEALKLNSSHGVAHYLRSRALQARGDSAKSEEAMAHAIQLSIDPEKLKNDDPRNWTQFFMSASRPQ